MTFRQSSKHVLPDLRMKIGRKKIYFRTHFPNIFAEKKYFVYDLAKTCLLLQKLEKINVSTLIQRKIEKNKVDSILFTRFLRNISFRL